MAYRMQFFKWSPKGNETIFEDTYYIASDAWCAGLELADRTLGKNFDQFARGYIYALADHNVKDGYAFIINKDKDGGDYGVTVNVVNE